MSVEGWMQEEGAIVQDACACAVAWLVSVDSFCGVGEDLLAPKKRKKETLTVS